MPRKARITIAGAVHHVMSRGVDGMPIFRTDDDYRFFLVLLCKQIEASGYLLYAWALMSNHYHLVMRISDYPLSAMMRLLNGQYAQYFRKKFTTRGYLFQDRYKSIVTQDQRYIGELIRYVHLNPLRANVCTSLQELEQYPWCGHGVLTGRMHCEFQETVDVLKFFGDALQEQRKNYRLFIQEGLHKNSDIDQIIRNSNNETELKRSTSCWVIGNQTFIHDVLAREEAKRLRIARFAQEGLETAEVCRIILEQFSFGDVDIRKRTRGGRQSDARKICAFMAHRSYEIPVIEIARFFNISSPSASRLIARGEEVLRQRSLQLKH